MAEPSTLGPYRILGVLGRGGMGVVYRGEHADTGEAVAVKTVRLLSGGFLTSIRREIHALRHLKHPGIVEILDEGVTDGLPWYAMPLMEERSLGDWIDTLWPRTTEDQPEDGKEGNETTLPSLQPGEPARVIVKPSPNPLVRLLEPTLTLIRRLCVPLAYLHGEGLVHRDLKPENILLQEHGRPVLVDLGISVYGSAGREELEVGLIAGTPAYMAPEQIRGELVDARADLYALGCILYECVTGRPPFIGESSDNICYQHLFHVPIPPSQRVSGLPQGLDELILKLLKKSPQDRLGYAVDLANALIDLGAASEPEEGPRPRAYLYRPNLVGRSDVLPMLNEAVERTAHERRGGLMLIRGESGVGKTRLALEVAQMAAKQRTLTTLRGRCLALKADLKGANAGGTPPLDPFRATLLEVADRAQRGGKTATDRLLGPRGSVLATYEPTLRKLPGQEAQPSPPPLSPEKARARVISCFLETLWALSETSPLLLVLDDLQWADDLSLSLLEALAKARLEAHGVLLVATYRIEETRPELEDLSRSPNVTTVTLGRLNPSNVEQMVSDMLARSTPRPVLDVLVAHSRGNPFFVKEYLLAAIGEGMLHRDERGNFRFETRKGAVAELSSLPLPHTLAELIERRLQRLDAKGRSQLRWCAVLGQEFESDLLFEIAEDSNAVLETLESLRESQILEETPQGRLRFVHDKIREIAYEQIPRAERIELHRKAGETLEARYAEAPDMAPTLGHHFARALLHEKAGFYFARAAKRAREIYANREAIRFYRAAIDEFRAPHACAEENELSVLQEALGDVLGLIGRHDEARDAYAAALNADHQNPSLDRARIYRKVGKISELHHQHNQALELYAQAEVALGDIPSESADAWWDEWLQIQIERISVYYWLADVERIHERIEAIRPVVEQNGTASQRGRFLHAMTQLNIWRERYVPSRETVQWARDCFAAFETASEAEEAHWILTARCSLAIILMLHDELIEAEAQMFAAWRAAERVGDLEMHARCLVYLAVIQRRLGRLDMISELAERGLSIASAARMDEYIGAALGNLASIALLERGDHAEVEKKAREALSRWETLSRVYPFQWLARMPLACVKLAKDDVEDAVAQARGMVDAQQLRLPDKINAALEAAVTSFGEGSTSKTKKALLRAFRAARRLGYV